MKNNEWLHDFEEFLSVESNPPGELSAKVFSQINSLLNPSSWLIFAKLLGIQIVIGFLSLSICHQFGLNPFHTDFSLADWFMKVGGHNLCMSFCGVFFIATSVLASGLLLTIEETKALKTHQLLQMLSLGVISFLLLVLFGAEVTLGIAAFWFLGALVGGIAATETVWLLKKVW